MVKLHQFIEKHAKKNLETHLIKVTGLLEAATSPGHFLELFASVFYGNKQLLLVAANLPDEFGWFSNFTAGLWGNWWFNRLS